MRTIVLNHRLTSPTVAPPRLRMAADGTSHAVTEAGVPVCALTYPAIPEAETARRLRRPYPFCPACDRLLVEAGWLG